MDARSYRKKLFGWSINLSQILNTALRHTHVTFTLPGWLRHLLFQRGFRSEDLSKLAGLLYSGLICRNRELGPEWKAGMLTTVHKCGNGLNFNPHVHMIATRDLVNVATGEIREINFIESRSFFIQWREAVLRHLVRKKILSPTESSSFRKAYRKGFHCYFQPINGKENDVLGRRRTKSLAPGQPESSIPLNTNRKTAPIARPPWKGALSFLTRPAI